MRLGYELLKAASLLIISVSIVSLLLVVIVGVVGVLNTIVLHIVDY